MGYKTFLKLVCVALVTLLCVGNAAAFDVSKYATQSKLATGKWVKITIPENGVYEITYDEMRAMGFNNPSQVRLYGHGGFGISENLNGSAIDDLVPVRVKRFNDKICFYGNGPIKYTLTGSGSTPRFQRAFNPYSQVGCYFLTEESTPEQQVNKKNPLSITNYVNTPYCFNFFHHEKELSTYSSSGKEMLGEDITEGAYLFDYDMPGIADSTIVVTTSIAANADTVSFAKAVLHSGGATDTTSYSAGLSRIYKPSKDAFYNVASPYGFLKLSHPAEHGQFEPYLDCSSKSTNLSFAYLDYFILTYCRNNVIDEGEDNQLLMGYAPSRGNERYQLPGASENVVVWIVNDTNNPLEMTLKKYDDESGSGYAFFSSPANYSYFVAFDPTRTLKKISSFEPVLNQNLHALQTPDLLIITDKLYHEQAERVAKLHRAVDGIDVAVVDQDQIFNEFSSGTRDAMAYRLLCKMLYDRNPSKLKNVLLFGTGSVDNRQLMGEREGVLLTYQSDNSNHQDNSFSSDDFFTFLADNSGANVTTEKMTIGVGRMTCSSVEEARSDVDKLVEYYATPDYGVWRNNALVISDSPDKGEYLFQGEGYKNLIDNELYTGMQANTVHNSQYPRSTIEPELTMDRKSAVTGKQLLKQDLQSGIYFGTYVGHAGSSSFTKHNKLWVNSDVAGTSYKHFPILTTACCEVAKYDTGVCGIAELMYHKRDGGAIALLTTNRMVMSDGNDLLNRSFIRSMFSYHDTGKMLTLGEVCKESKNNISGSDQNKRKFFLLGDPAIKVNYPISRFNITKVNNTDLTNATAMAEVSPLMKFDIEAQVVDSVGDLDASFNGDATATLYDKQLLFTTITKMVDGEYVNRDIYFNRAKLAEVSGRVENGVFRGQMIGPKSPRAADEAVLLRVYAHKDNTDYMVNGFTQQVTMLPYDEYGAISDDVAPVISTMFINNEEAFSAGAVVASDGMLYITASDNEGFNMQSNVIDDCMTLDLDDGKTVYADVSCHVIASDGGKTITIEYPLNNLSEGMHWLTYTVYDVVGNLATRTISFMVAQDGKASLVADKWPAYTNENVSFDLETSLPLTPEVAIRVTDATGKLVWTTTSSSFPVEWDMTDMSGNRVPAGLYRYYGTYNNGINYGGTPISRLIVLDPVKRPLKLAGK